MKQKDVTLFLLIGIISAIISFVISGAVISPAKNRSQQVEVVDPITADFSVPASDNKYFNKDAINPTKLIQIGDGTPNATPFNGTGQ